jgi:hypothetical protein
MKLNRVGRDAPLTVLKSKNPTPVMAANPCRTRKLDDHG